MMQLHKLHTAIHLLVSRSNCTSVSDVQQNLHHIGLYSCCIVVVDSHGTAVSPEPCHDNSHGYATTSPAMVD